MSGSIDRGCACFASWLRKAVCGAALTVALVGFGGLQPVAAQDDDDTIVLSAGGAELSVTPGGEAAAIGAAASAIAEPGHAETTGAAARAVADCEDGALAEGAAALAVAHPGRRRDDPELRRARWSPRSRKKFAPRSAAAAMTTTARSARSSRIAAAKTTRREEGAAEEGRAERPSPRPQPAPEAPEPVPVQVPDTGVGMAGVAGALLALRGRFCRRGVWRGQLSRSPRFRIGRGRSVRRITELGRRDAPPQPESSHRFTSRPTIARRQHKSGWAHFPSRICVSPFTFDWECPALRRPARAGESPRSPRARRRRYT